MWCDRKGGCSPRRGRIFRSESAVPGRASCLIQFIFGVVPVKNTNFHMFASVIDLESSDPTR